MKLIFANIIFEATHNWPGCDIEEVAYLKHEHRHIFHITAYLEVKHDDRDVEFIYFKHQIEKYLAEKYPNKKLGATSCEMLAVELINNFGLTKCIVAEDRENGVEITA